MGYRKVGYLEQIVYVIAQCIRKKWEWIFKEGGGADNG